MFGRKPRRFNFYALLTFALGGITGALIALLYAPTTGRKLQKQIKDVFEDQVENVQKNVSNVLKKVVA